MFFLSKVLPMLIYPVGMASMFITLAGCIARRAPTVAKRCCFIALSLLFLAGNRWVNFALVRALEGSYLPSLSPPTVDAIVILGGTVEAAYFPRDNVHLLGGDRLLFGAMLYRNHRARLVLVGNGVRPWRQLAPDEGESASQALALMGVPRSAIFEEPPASNTYQEAIAVKKLLQAHNLRQILLVTSAMHMPRALRTFRRQGIDSIASPTDFTVTQRDVEEAYASFEDIVLSSIPNVEVLASTTTALKEYIGLAYYWARGWL
jgi:uncharacterized SAM-binding protein YcdF (DUF218 family)